MKKHLFIFFLLLYACFSANAQQKRSIHVDDLFALKDLTDPQISPDGKWIAYVVETLDAKKDKSNKDIYMVPFSGGEPLQLTSHAENDAHPRWSPNNRYLAFLSKRNKKNQVFLMNRNGGEAIQLTEIKQGVSDFSWAPDSKRLALVIADADPDEPAGDDEDDKEKEKTKKPIVITRLQFKFDEYGYLKELYNHLYTFDIQTKQLKQITSGPYNDAGEVWSAAFSSPQWSPDGKQIAFVSNRSPQPDANRNTDIFLVPAEGGEVKKLTTNEGPDEAPQWSPDGKWIVYQAQHQPDLIWYDTTEVMIVPATGGEPKSLTRDLDRNCFMASFSPDGRAIYFILEHEGKQLLSSISPTGSNLNKNAGGENVVYDYDLGSQQIVVLSSRTELPAEVFSSSNGKSKQITFTNAKAIANLQFGATERVRYKSKDGTTVEAFIVKPAQFDPSKKYPLILWPHGGPTSQYMEDFDFRAQLFAASGYVVLLVNPRGSTGYGEDFCKAIFGDWGNKDYDDEIAGVDHVISLGYVDGDKMAVGGWSYGGMMTDFIITKTTRFKAAMSGASEANYFLDYGVDHYQYEWEKEVGLPWEKPEAYLKMSPFFNIENVKTPTLVLCGESDQNVPLVNSEQLYQALKRLGIDTMLVIYPGEPHGISVPSYQKDRLQRYIAWFDHYIKGTPAKVPAK